MGEEIIMGEGSTGDDTSTVEDNKSILTGEDVDKDIGKDADKDTGKDTGKDTDHSSDDADKKSEDGEADKDSDGAPEKYKDFVLPEGMKADEDALAEFQTLAKETKLSQEDAQKFVSLQSKLLTEAAEAQIKTWTDTQEAWAKAAQDDAEYGKGSYDESISVARFAMRDIGGAPLAKALDETGAGNHPEIIRAFYRMGKAMKEDGFNVGEARQAAPRSQADRIFPNHGK